MKKMEIERRFLLYPCSMKRFLKRLGIPYRTVKIEQFYLVADEERVERYRKEADAYVKTLKKGAGLVREETEERISKEDFEKAREHNRGGVIRKVRRIFEYGGHIYELDSFKGVLKGLNILEIEFASEKEAHSFRLPESFAAILVAEVTDDRTFSNGSLSRLGHIPPIQTELSTILGKIDARESFLKASTVIELAPYESGAHAAKAIFYTLLRSVEANKEAILSGDEDPERLHQLRVAMRKLRALLSQMAPLFDESWRMMHKERLAALMRRTGRKRDIDVYLMEMPRYRSLIPKTLHHGLQKLERYLQRQLQQESRELASFLRSESFAEEMRILFRFATTEDGEGLGKEARTPIIVSVAKALRRRYRKVLKKGSSIDAHSPAHSYHMLRIDVKKLRYMMEFFSSILQPEAYRTMLKKLKTIQSILGAHQDLDVQREHLGEFARIPELHTQETVAAIEALRETMAKIERQKRREFREAFEEFAETKTVFETMICKF
ncbi:CHAD domain-containing protein [Hydrogenimonas sp.]|uniref:CYTH and CHAD domain-containing protein n=1 Tax=Hydrogenimonas sp. TaxID=2231112 RepID=UPI00260F12AD|nr:CHAD domain-containing protein [Hydrogenimonas sp.]